MLSNEPAEFALLVADLYEAAGAVRRSGERIAATAGQTQARWQTLSAVSDRPAPVPQVAQRLGVSRQNVQRVVNDLCRDGLVTLADNPGHRTSPLVTLLPPGRVILDRLTDLAAVAHAEQAERLGDMDLVEARRMLQRLTEVVRDR